MPQMGPGNVEMPALHWEILGEVEPEEGGAWGQEGFQCGIILYSPPWEALIFSKGTELFHLKISCNSHRPPSTRYNPTWKSFVFSGDLPVPSGIWQP